MRSLRTLAALATASVLVLAGCSTGSGSASSGDSSASGSPQSGAVVTLKVGASPTPHAKILQYIEDNLAAKAGLDIQIVEYTDYVQPNQALNSGDIDANYFQHVPYLKSQEADFGYKFSYGEGIHLEPMGVFSSKIKDLKDFPQGGTIGVISDPSNQARALKVLATNGLVTLPSSGDINVNTVTPLKGAKLQEVEGPQLVRSLSDVDIAVINGNYAMEGGLSLAKDALATESAKDNPNANILAWNSSASGEKLAAIKKLDGLLHSDEVRKYIETTWSDGSVIPAF